ncbi:hypothetical protein Acsp03_19030 [Actinomadura sp. NBRC 104412]|uniref:hypothetical protein n=1 Tax=Actinomadura sp. NBRC 104412 TaxID=3032203 RepID=UPI0024A10C0A|nr:hypothetical protein [Actinomadura sp. NBRC 104412]GLZ04437.1 hypothetical protein Acsp03_19030 [Actinomadura sp. NBRC 104412]
MTAQAGSGPDRHRDLTRPDLPLPRPLSGQAPAPPPPLAPPVPPEPAPPRSVPSRGRNWHRMHYPIGVFLVAYGVTGLVTGLIGWDDRREELAGYVGAGAATAVLAVVKAIELALVALAVAGIGRRRDVWFLPALAGWLAGFGVFTLLDLVKGNWGALLEHVVFLAAFALLLFLSYGLSVKARVGRAAAARTAPPPPDAPAPAAPGVPAPVAAPSANLSRTQEFALAALNRLQQRVTPAFGAPRPRPPAPPSPSPSPAAASASAPDPAPAPAPAPPSEDASPQTVVDAEAPEPAAGDGDRTVQAPLPAKRPAPPDATRPLPLPDSSDQE